MHRPAACAALLASLALTTAGANAAPRPRTAIPQRLANTRTVPVAPRQKLAITVLWDDAMSTRESALWIGYLFARMEFVSRNGDRYERVPGIITPVFDEEVFARSEAAKVYRELRSQGKGTDSAYFNDLEKVDAAGFMPEYVWQYLHRDSWSTPPATLRSSEFARWVRQNLPHHAVQTRGRVAFQTGTTAGS